MRLDAEQRFAIIPEWVLYHPDLDPRAVVLYGVLARHCDRKGKAFPSRSRLATLLHCSTKTVDRSLRELQAAQAVTWERRLDPAGDPTSSMYLLHVSPPEGVGTPLTPPRDTDVPTGRDTDVALNESQSEREVSPNGLTRAQQVCTHQRCPVEEPCWLHQPDEWDGRWILNEGRRRDALWEATVLAMRRQPGSKSERGAWNTAVRNLREVEASPLDILARAREYRRRWPKIDITPTGLESNWGLLATPKPGSVSAALAGVASARQRLEEQ